MVKFSGRRYKHNIKDRYQSRQNSAATRQAFRQLQTLNQHIQQLQQYQLAQNARLEEYNNNVTRFHNRVMKYGTLGLGLITAAGVAVATNNLVSK